MEQRPGPGPIKRGEEWWHQRPDGGWWRWNAAHHRWDEHPTPPPPPDTGPSPVQADQSQLEHSGPEATAPLRAYPASAQAPATGHTDPAGPQPQPSSAGYYGSAHGAPSIYGASPYDAYRPVYVLPDGRALPPLAKWWQRLLAWMLDATIVGILAGIIVVVTRVVATGSTSISSRTAVTVALAVIFVLVVPAYFVPFHAITGATVGKRVLGIRLCDKDTGGTIGFGRAYVRSLLTGLLWLVFYAAPFNYLWPLWDPQKQAWHDKAVNSIVLTSPR